MNIHNSFRNIYFARVRITHFCPPLLDFETFTQSGQSLIEHSYRADSDLSPAGWEYAEKLKEFVVQKYNKSLEQRGLDTKERRLVVSKQMFSSEFSRFLSYRYGPQRVDAVIILRGRSSLHQHLLS
jgi:hypothetical protein